MKPVLYILLGIGVYELLRAELGRAVRRNVPTIFQRELTSRSEFAGILAPVLGTPVVSQVVGMVAEKSVYDTLPTLVGPRDYQRGVVQ